MCIYLTAHNVKIVKTIPVSIDSCTDKQMWQVHLLELYFFSVKEEENLDTATLGMNFIKA